MIALLKSIIVNECSINLFCLLYRAEGGISPKCPILDPPLKCTYLHTMTNKTDTTYILYSERTCYFTSRPLYFP